MSQEIDHPVHHPSEKLDEISSHPLAESSLIHEAENASSLNQVESRTLPADGSSGDHLDVDHLSEELEGSSLKPEGNLASSDKQDDDDDDDEDDDEDDESFKESDDYIYDDDPPVYDCFERVYRCLPLSSVGKTHLEIGNKIIMPADALMRLMQTKISMPMQFEIRNKSTGRVSNCGVFEFTGQDAHDIFLPEWMMKNMELQAGDLVTIKNKDLENGTYIKLQPHSTDFLGISNPKAVLEENLQNFSCLTMGDTIMISHGSKNFYINIVETKPSAAVGIINVDCNVDFAPPLDYKEPEKLAARCCVLEEKEEANQKPKFKPFTGLARRLVEPTSMELDLASLPNEHDKNEAAEAECMSKRSSRGLVFESNGSQCQNRGRELKKKNVEAETSKDKPKFQPFTGKKYKLAG